MGQLKIVGQIHRLWSSLLNRLIAAFPMPGVDMEGDRLSPQWRMRRSQIGI